MRKQRDSTHRVSGEPGAVQKSLNFSVSAWSPNRGSRPQRLKPLQRFWAMIETHMVGVLGWTSHHITNAALEGNNSWVRGISIRGRGYRNVDNLMVMLFHCGCN